MRSLLPTAASGGQTPTAAAILERDAHSISRKNISNNALRVLYDLNKAGHEAYLVGGCIRDLLLNGHPKDFDVATDATPEQVHQLFRRSRIIGRRFKIVHVRFGREVIEVTTFRAAHQASDPGTHGEHNAQGMLLRDNVFGSLREDALRRDFTVNALYYTVDGFRLLDYTGGLQDLDNRLLRIIGDAEQRYREDPVRMLRVVRFAAKLGFTIEDSTAAPLVRLAEHLGQVAPARLFDEMLKLFLNGAALRVFELLVQYQLFAPLFPGTAQCLAQGDKTGEALIKAALGNTDQRIADNKPVTPAFLFASLLWPVYKMHRQQLEDESMPPWQARQLASQQAIAQQLQVISIPKRYSIPVREIWNMQYNLAQAKGKRALSLLGHARFRAAYDFLLLREQAGEALPRGSQFWTELQADNPTQLHNAGAQPNSRPRRRRNSASRRKPASR